MESGFDNFLADQYVDIWLEHANFKHSEKHEVGLRKLPDGTYEVVRYWREDNANRETETRIGTMEKSLERIPSKESRVRTPEKVL